MHIVPYLQVNFEDTVIESRHMNIEAISISCDKNDKYNFSTPAGNSLQSG